MSTYQPVCDLCGEPMPPGEEMFKYHGYSGPCPKPPKPKPAPISPAETPPPAPAEAQEAVEARLERIRVRWSQAGLTSFSQDHADVAWLLSLVRPPVAVPEGREKEMRKMVSHRNKPQRREAPMTLDLEALKRVAEAATPGPWEVSDADVRTSAFVRARGFGHVCNAPVPYHDWHEPEANRESQARKNIAHIATFDPPTVLALIARCEAAEKANRTRTDYDLRCQECGRAHILDTSLPSEIWNQIAKPEDHLCTTCIDDRLAVKGLTAEAEFYFVGNALVSKLYRDQTEARAEGFREGIEAAAKDLHAHVVLGDGHATACAIERHIRALAAGEGGR